MKAWQIALPIGLAAAAAAAVAIISGKKNADRKCVITFGSGTLAKGNSLTLQVRITPADWTEFDLSNDYSGGGAEKLCVKLNGKKIFGSEP